MWRIGLKETGRYATGLLGALLLAAIVSAAGGKAGILAATLARGIALVRLDFGTSAMTGLSAAAEIAKRLPATLELVGGGAVLALVIGVPLGLLLSWGRALRAAAPLIQLVAAAPVFCAGLALLWLANRFHWDVSAQTGLGFWPALLRGDVAAIVAALPAFGLPALVVGAAGAASVELAVRSAAREAGAKPYRNGLRLMGLGAFEVERLYMAPLVIAGLLASLGEIALSLFSAAAVAEWVFDWPGAAILFIRSVALHDWSVAAVVLFVFAAIALTAAFIGALGAHAIGGIRSMNAMLAKPQRPALRAIIRVAGFAGLGVIAVVVGLSNVLARQPADMVQAGDPLSPPSPKFPFGTDLFGRDVASEVLHALAVTVSHAAVAMLVTIAAGGVLGFVAVRFPLRAGAALRWLAGILGAVPPLFLAILLIGLTSRDFAPLAAGLAAAPLAFVRAFDRARGLARSRHADFARATGIPAATLLRRDLAYEVRDGFLYLAARSLAAVTITLSTVSFFGFGAAPPHRDLGLMIAAARETYFDAWWTALFPALALMAFILCARLAASLDEGEQP